MRHKSHCKAYAVDEMNSRRCSTFRASVLHTKYCLHIKLFSTCTARHILYAKLLNGIHANLFRVRHGLSRVNYAALRLRWTHNDDFMIRLFRNFLMGRMSRFAHWTFCRQYFVMFSFFRWVHTGAISFLWENHTTTCAQRVAF